MSKVLFGVIGAMMISMFSYYQFFVVPMKNKIEEQTKVILAQELRDKEQKAAIENLQNDFELQTSSLIDLQKKNQAIEAEMNRYLDIFKRHNLSKLARAKPGLIETRVNKGTKDVFDSIEKDSVGIDSLDDGLQLQPNTK